MSDSPAQPNDVLRDCVGVNNLPAPALPHRIEIFAAAGGISTGMVLARLFNAECPLVINRSAVRCCPLYMDDLIDRHLPA